MPTVHVDSAGFSRQLNEYAAASGKSILEAFKYQCILLARELIQRTPPFSGKSIVRMLDARKANLSNAESDVATLTALNVGKRRVEKDIRKVIWGYKDGAVNRGGTSQSWSSQQMCEGKHAIRLFAKKDGTVYGVDQASFIQNADVSTLQTAHFKARGKRGRVTSAGSRTRDVGRWKWIDATVTQEESVKAYIKERQWFVGQGKGGWLASAIACGAKKTGGWIGKHVYAGTAIPHFENPYKPSITFVNKSSWARGGDPDRIIEKSLAGRAKAMAGDVARILKEKWGA